VQLPRFISSISSQTKYSQFRATVPVHKWWRLVPRIRPAPPERIGSECLGARHCPPALEPFSEVFSNVKQNLSFNWPVAPCVKCQCTPCIGAVLLNLVNGLWTGRRIATRVLTMPILKRGRLSPKKKFWQATMAPQPRDGIPEHPTNRNARAVLYVAFDSWLSKRHHQATPAVKLHSNPRTQQKQTFNPRYTPLKLHRFKSRYTCPHVLAFFLGNPSNGYFGMR